jgi:ribosomal protein L11 methylase PrmA
VNKSRASGSFRDSSGFVFSQKGVFFRQVNKIYKKNYDYLMNSGLYGALVASNFLLPHKEAKIKLVESDSAYKVIKPEPIPFISYPYEWCFSQLKEAALLTLMIQKKALEFEMSLKDASAYNIQFTEGKPILIDTLSFERYKRGEPWVAYRQFCEHFLAPLSLMSYKNMGLNQLLRIYLDGVPLEVASSLLPWRTRFDFSLLSHLHLHGRSKQYFADKVVKVKKYRMSRRSLLGLIESLEKAVISLKSQTNGTEWADYYDKINYSRVAFTHKKKLVESFLCRIKPKIVWDLGANIGVFSRLASKRGALTISFDADPLAVEKNYLESKDKKEENILPLVLDLTNPSPGVGWESKERVSLLERGPADTILALALIHHLAIGNNLPFEKMAQLFSKICRFLIIEFVPKKDSQVQKMLSTREDIFVDYKQKSFEGVFKKYFKIKDRAKIRGSKRIIYLIKNKT